MFVLFLHISNSLKSHKQLLRNQLQKSKDDCKI